MSQILANLKTNVTIFAVLYRIELKLTKTYKIKQNFGWWLFKIAKKYILKTMKVELIVLVLKCHKLFLF